MYHFIPSDFENNAFSNNVDCPLARLLKRYFPLNTNELCVLTYGAHLDSDELAVKFGNVKLNGKIVKGLEENTFRPEHYNAIMNSISNGTFKSATIEIYEN